MTRARTILAAFLAGLIGVAVALVAQHAWQDHQALHELATIELQRIQQAQQAKP